ncbi:MAG: hypothetical protein R3A11_04795 [Bdellovibrionota bacterium]
MPDAHDCFLQLWTGPFGMEIVKGEDRTSHFFYEGTDEEPSTDEQAVTGERVLENIVYELHRFSRSIWVYHDPESDVKQRNAWLPVPASSYLVTMA